jgi:hypothetical protein
MGGGCLRVLEVVRNCIGLALILKFGQFFKYQRRKGKYMSSESSMNCQYSSHYSKMI